MNLFVHDNRPRFRSHLRCEPALPDCTFVLTEQNHFLLQGRTFSALAPLLDGSRTVPELIDELRGSLTAAEIIFALNSLNSKGYITMAPAAASQEQEAFWEKMGLDVADATTKIATANVSVIATADCDPAPMKTIIQQLGVTIRDDAERAVVLTGDYLDPALSVINAESIQRARPWLLIKPSGSEIMVGPIFDPNATGCWECLQERLAAHRKADSFLAQKQGVLGPFTPPPATLPSTYHMACALAGTEVAKWLANTDYSRLMGRVLTIDTTTLDKQEHTLTRRPQCRRCGDPTMVATAQAQPIELSRRIKHFTSDGGHRTSTPEETLTRFAHHVSPITGIISNLQQMTCDRDNRGAISTFITDHNFLHQNDDLHFFRESLRARSGGKGKTLTQAKVSAICESIERYSGVFAGDEARISATMADLGDAAIDPSQVMLFSEQQIADRESWLARGSRVTWVANRFDRRQKLEWSPLWTLTSGDKRYLPTAYCYYGYPRERCNDVTRGDSNGCAAGSNLEEAILQGLLELVERDSVAIWWYNRLCRPGVDLSSFDDPYLDEVIRYYRAISRDVVVLDLTSDIDIPVFAAISHRRDKAGGQVIYGFGAHFDARIALCRAVSELHQSLPFVMNHDSGPLPELNPTAARFWQASESVEHAYLKPADGAQRTMRHYASHDSIDLYDDLIRCVRLVEDQGLEVMVMNQSRPDTGVTVARVVVPGLRHFWPRFAPGRLYDVPVQMGWKRQSLSEEELNPWPIYL